MPQARLLFVSTAEVYGGSFLTARGAVDERAAIDPMNAYAASKAAAELFIAQMARHGLRAIRLRPFNHTGPGQSVRFRGSIFCRAHGQYRDFVPGASPKRSNLDAKRDFLDVRDVASAYVKAMAAANLDEGAALNIASGEARRIGDILESLPKRAKLAIRIMRDPSRLLASTFRSLWAIQGSLETCSLGYRESPSSRFWPTCSRRSAQNLSSDADRA